MKFYIIILLDRLPYLGRLRKQVRNQGNVPPGHYHSPIPHQDDIAAFVAAPPERPAGLPDVDLNQAGQLQSLQNFLPNYPGLAWSAEADRSLRYSYPNPWFGLADAIFLHCFLCANRPRRIVEIGCRYSSAVLLDTVEAQLQEKPEITFIEPNPDRLLGLLKPGDRDLFRLIRARTQECPREPFDSLAS